MLSPIEIAVDVDLQQDGRMMGRAARRLWYSAIKPQPCEIKLRQRPRLPGWISSRM
jgi:hypothetical protein